MKSLRVESSICLFSLLVPCALDAPRAHNYTIPNYTTPKAFQYRSGRRLGFSSRLQKIWVVTPTASLRPVSTEDIAYSNSSKRVVDRLTVVITDTSSSYRAGAMYRQFASATVNNMPSA